MKVAVPTFGDRVSPRFDCAASFLVLTVDCGEIVQREEVSAAQWPPHERVNYLVRRGVDVVICGGIDRWSAASLGSVGITLYGWVAGSIEESLEALRRGELQALVMPRDGACCGRSRPGHDAAAWQEGPGQTEQPRGVRRGRHRGNRDSLDG